MKGERHKIRVAVALLVALSCSVVFAGGADAATRNPRGHHEYFFAEGTTRPGFQEYICLSHVDTTKIPVDVEYMLDSGKTGRATAYVGQYGRTTLDVNSLVGPGHDVSMRLSCPEPFIAERAMYFDTGGTRGASCVRGASEPSRHWYFAEGYTGEGFREYLCLQNPDDEAASVEAVFCDREGGRTAVPVDVPARARRTIDVGLTVGAGREVSAEVRSTNGVRLVAERAMYCNAPGYRGGHCTMGQPLSASRYYFAEGSTRPGFQEYLSLFNPGNATLSVEARLLPGDGEPLISTVDVPAGSRRTLDVNALVGPGRDVSAVLSASGGFCAERPVYFSAFGTVEAHCQQGNTLISSRWAFAEGTAREGFHTFFCIANPGDRPASVRLYTFSKSYVQQQVDVDVPPGARVTFDPSPLVETGSDFSTFMHSGYPVAVERVQYSADTVPLSGGTCTVGTTDWERPRFGDVRAYVNAYGNLDVADLDGFSRYDVATLDPYDFPEGYYRTLQASGTMVLGYLDVGEAETYRRSWEEVSKHPELLLGANPDWPGCYYVDTNNPEWHRILLNIEIPYLLSRGALDGLCLDMVDVVDVFPRLKPGMIDLIRKIKERYPQLVLVPNRGFGVLGEMLPYIDAFKYEDLSCRYDFDTGTYYRKQDLDEQAVLADALDRKEMQVMALDHVRTEPPDTAVAAEAYRTSQVIAARMGARFIWYANSVEQDHPLWPFIDYR